jgi:hypothetical protein
MAATLKLFMDIAGADTAPGSENDISALSPMFRFKTADDIAIDTNNPIPIPAAGTIYSYWKNLYIKMTADDGKTVNNFLFYTDGTVFGTGVTVMVGDEYPTKNSGSDAGYEIATGTPGATGDEMVAAHAGLTGSTDVETFVTGAKLTLADGDFISEAGNVLNATGEMTNYFLLQMNAINTASSGNLADETFTFLYDEV